MATRTTYLDEAAKRRLIHRLSRIEGQVRAVKAMVAEDRCADEVLIQATAARGALGQFIARLLESHLLDCARTCMEGEPEEVMTRVSRAVQAVLKHGS